jgi:hypothetical protein
MDFPDILTKKQADILLLMLFEAVMIKKLARRNNFFYIKNPYNNVILIVKIG